MRERWIDRHPIWVIIIGFTFFFMVGIAMIVYDGGHGSMRDLLSPEKNVPLPVQPGIMG